MPKILPPIKKEQSDSYFWFEKTIGEWKFITNDTLYNKNSDKWLVGVKPKGSNSDYVFMSRMNKVHLLQNLVFSLIGKELQ